MEFYRYEDQDWWDHLEVVEKVYSLDKETPCGYWIISPHGHWRRWVSKTSRKRFAYPTRQEAYESFLARKERQVKILTAQLSKATKALNLGKGLQLAEFIKKSQVKQLPYFDPASF